MGGLIWLTALCVLILLGVLAPYALYYYGCLRLRDHVGSGMALYVGILSRERDTRLGPYLIWTRVRHMEPRLAYRFLLAEAVEGLDAEDRHLLVRFIYELEQR